MIESSLYGRIWREMQRQLRIGAVTNRGRPTKDPVQKVFNRELRALKLALKELPADLRTEWKDKLPKTLGDLIDTHRTDVARTRARVRREKRLKDGGSHCEPGLAAAANRKSESKAQRLLAVDLAMRALEAGNGKVMAKTVADMLGHPDTMNIGTIQKYIAEIRRARHE